MLNFLNSIKLKIFNLKHLNKQNSLNYADFKYAANLAFFLPAVFL